MRLRAGFLACAAALIAIAVFAERPAATPGPAARDFESYWSAGRTWNAGGDAYGRAIWNAERQVRGVDVRRDEVLPFIGPPATLLGWSLLAHLSYGTATNVWLALLAAALLALVAAVVRASGARVTAFTLLAALALAIAFGPVTSNLALGQLALCAVLGLVAAAEGGVALATAGAFVAFLQPNLAPALISQLGRNRATLALALAASAAYLAGAAAAGWSWPAPYVRAVLVHGAAERFDAIQISPRAIAYGFGMPAHATAWIALAAALGALAAGLVLAKRVPDRFARLAAFGALVPFVTGFFHEHDLVVVYPAALWCALRTTGGTRVTALAGTLLVAVDWLGLAQRPTGAVQSALLAATAICAFAALGGPLELRATAAAAIPFGVLFAAGVWLAAAHPAPVWPDALVAFHAAPAAGISAVWLAEQQAAGLTAPVPAWSLLRLLPLVGCALLVYAIYRHSACRRTA